MDLVAGLTASIELTVTDRDTAIALGSGDVPVLATPRLVALVEEATVAATAGHLPDGQTTVGTRVALDHVAPTAVGATVLAQATLLAVDGRALSFAVEVRSSSSTASSAGGTVLASGQVDRVMVDRERFLARLGG